MHKYVILENIATGSRFFSFNNEEDQTKLYDGTVAYVVVGYADTMKEAQIKLYGYSSTTCDD